MDCYAQNVIRNSALFLLFISWTSIVIAQAPHCPVRVDMEPTLMNQERKASLINQINFPIFSSWQDIDNLKNNDNNYAEVILDGYRRSTVLKGSSMSFNVPTGATISGIELIVKGHSEGNGIPKGTTVQLTNGSGAPIGIDKVNTEIPTDYAWSTTFDSTDVLWKYGGKDELWGLSPSAALLNSGGFGYQIQLRNMISKPLQVYIDQIYMVIHYTPLYTICSTHACVPFYVLDDDPLLTYNWLLPQGFELISDSEHDAAINIGVSYATYGTYEICNEAYIDEVFQGTCCRRFNYLNCEPGSVGDLVFLDNNANSYYDTGDDLVSGVSIQLLDVNGGVVATTISDSNGKYLFENVNSGAYYIKVINNTEHIFTSANIGSSDFDSDITNTNGIGTSDVFHIVADQEISDLDIGFAPLMSIGNYVWEDTNADGIQDQTEFGKKGIVITLVNESTNEINTTITDSHGYYSFDSLVAGNYLINFEMESNYQVSPFHVGDINLDNDVMTINSPFKVGSNAGGVIDNIDAGCYRFATIGDYVWEDINMDGIQDDDEPGLAEVILNLKNESGDIVKTTISDAEGYYLFDKVVPGRYFIEVNINAKYRPTILLGGDIDTDNDGFLANSIVTSDELNISSNGVNNNVDFGFILQSSDIGGYVWSDDNRDGQYQANETLFSDIVVSLYSENHVFVESTTTEMGIYFFSEILAGNYYLVFDNPIDYVPTVANQGVDITDSDITSLILDGATDVFNVQGGHDDFSFGAGYILQNGSMVSGIVWDDFNNNGQQDTGESNIENAIITIKNNSGTLSYSTITDSEGYYLFENIIPSDYQICVNTITGYSYGFQDVGDDTTDSDIDKFTGCTSSFGVVSGQVISNIDAAMTQNVSISGMVFLDINADGIRVDNENGIDSISVKLYDTNGTEVAETITNTVDGAEGVYIFENLKTMNYIVVFEIGDQYIVTSSNIGDENTDSDITSTILNNGTDIISPLPGQNIVNIDGGVYSPATISDRVWYDSNKDGIQDTNEIGAENIEVVIFHSFGIPIDTVTTNSEGIYTFTNLKQGLYIIRFLIDQEYTISPAGVGTDDKVDSDCDQTGTTPLISLAHGTTLNTISCGIFQAGASLRSVVWKDLNADGIRQYSEARVPNIKILLYDNEDEIIATTESNVLGFYSFENLQEGSYKIKAEINNETFGFTNMNIGNDDNMDSDVDTDGESPMFTNSDVLSVPNIDIGIFEYGSIISILWEDSNADGLQNESEKSLATINTTLFSTDGEKIAEYISTSDLENVKYKSLRPGKYFIKYNLENTYVESPIMGEIDDDYNSDMIKKEGGYISPVFNVESGRTMQYIDAGAYQGAQIISNVWYDDNQNGLQDDIGNIPNDIYVSIKDMDGISVATSGINNSGEVKFSGLAPGDYYLDYYGFETLMFTNHMGNSNNNSDITHNNGYGTTDMITLKPYNVVTNIDAGLLNENATLKLQETYTSSSISEISNIRTNENDQNISLEVFPNPTTHYINVNIKGILENAQVTIFDNSYKIVFNDLMSNVNRIDVSSYPPGFYIVKVGNNNRQLTRKILVIE
ncbi:MAG: SdrD B-like domain-containing protein [Saprospiraceae bacterium]